MRVAELFSPVLAATLNAREQPYGANTGSRFKLFQAVSAYRLDHETSQITTPLLITCCERERCWPGQSQRLHNRLRGPRALIHFSSGDAADPHGVLLGPALRETRIFDWLDHQLARGDDDL